MATLSIPFPCVAGLAWIPTYPNLGAVPSAGVQSLAKNHPWPLFRIGFGEVFRNGNPPPPGDMGGSFPGYMTMLDGQEYRGAVALTSVSLICSNGVPSGVSYLALRNDKVAGFTPVRLPKGITAFLGGTGNAVGPQIDLDPSGATIRYLTWFRIGWFAGLAGTIATSHLPVKAWMKLIYRLNKDRTSSVTLTGTYLPTQTTVCGWSLPRHEYVMLTATEAELAGFISAGFNKFGPGRPSVQIP